MEVFKVKEIFQGVFSDGKFLYTKNFLPGRKVYGEKLVVAGGLEFRQWDAFRSKLGAGLKNGLKEMPIKSGSKVLYLGCAEGTTVSHISDIIGNEGLLVGVDLSAVSMRRFVQLCEKRANIVPLLADALMAEEYPEEVFGKIRFDVLFQDIAQKNQAEIFLKNAQFLKSKGFGLLSVKARSISQSKNASTVFTEEANLLKKEFDILQTVRLEPFETDHALVLCKKKE